MRLIHETQDLLFFLKTQDSSLKTIFLPMLTRYGQREWLIIIAGVTVVVVLGILLAWWWLVGLAVVAGLALLSFFRDPRRRIPVGPGLMVSPADGVISSIHTVENYAPLGQDAVCVRIFLSVLNVHVNRSPCAGKVLSLTHKPGKFMNALNPQSAEVNESLLMVLGDVAEGKPIATVRQVSGAIARTIVCAAEVGDTLERGQRYGMIKFGSTTELYLPASVNPQVMVNKGDKVRGGCTVLAKITAQGEPATAPGALEPVASVRPQA